MHDIFPIYPILYLLQDGYTSLSLSVVCLSLSVPPLLSLLVCQSVCLFDWLSVWLAVYLIYPSLSLALSLSLSLSLLPSPSPSLRMYMYVYIYNYTHVYIYRYVCISILYIYMYVCLSLFLSLAQDLNVSLKLWGFLRVIAFVEGPSRLCLVVLA